PLRQKELTQDALVPSAYASGGVVRAGRDGAAAGAHVRPRAWAGRTCDFVLADSTRLRGPDRWAARSAQAADRSLRHLRSNPPGWRRRAAGSNLATTAAPGHNRAFRLQHHI